MMSKGIIIGLVIILMVLSGCAAKQSELNARQIQAMIDDTITKRMGASTPVTVKPAAPAPVAPPVNLKPFEDRLIKVEQGYAIMQADLANNKISGEKLNEYTQRMNKLQTSLNALNEQINAYANRGTTQLNNLQVQIATPNQTLTSLVSAYPQSVGWTITVTNTTTKTVNNTNIVGFIRYDHTLNQAAGYPQIATNDNAFQYLIANNINNQIQFNVVNGAGVIFPIPAGATITMQPRLILQTLKGSEYMGVVNFYISIYSISYDGG